MTSEEVRKKFLDFFEKRGHAVIPSASLVPEDDPTTLLTGSGMQPLIPYLFGKAHPQGKRLVNSQKCFRSEDIEEIGDNRHTTFFEMLGNWSLGDYFKQEQLPWFFEFLTKIVGLNPQKLYVTVFSGDEKNNIPQDDESAEIWKELFRKEEMEAKAVSLITNKKGSELGMQEGRIFYYDSGKNWWSRKGSPEDMPAGELGGPDSEVFYEFTDVEHDPIYGKHCHPNCDCGRFLEIGNSVFMEYEKREDGTFAKLAQKNVDFGGGLERIVAASNNVSDVFRTDLFQPIFKKLEEVAPNLDERGKRIFADHLRAATFLIADGVRPLNKEAGYILRRLLRRIIAHAVNKDIHADLFATVVPEIVKKFGETYPELQDEKEVLKVMEEEKSRFQAAIGRGLSELAKYKKLTAADAFKLYESYGLPFELVKELAPKDSAKNLKREDFEKEFEKHQKKSRAGAEAKFGGHGLLLDTGEIKAGSEEESKKVLRLHTATHLLQAALRKVLGNEVEQRGSDVNAARTRFDFTFPRKLTPEEIKKVEDLINDAVKNDLPVHRVELSLEEAKKTGALHFFKAKYPEVVKVYYIGNSLEDAFSKEFCNGPHVESTGEIGGVIIKKEEAVSAGVRRIRAELL